MPQLRVFLGFSNAPDHTLEETAQAVLDNLYVNPAFPNPPVTKAALQAALTAFSAAIAAAAMGGPADTAAKNNKRDALVALLRQLAGYVQENCGNNLATLLSSGFEAVSTNRASVPLLAPTIRDILNGNSGQLLLRVSPIANAKCRRGRRARPVAEWWPHHQFALHARQRPHAGDELYLSGPCRRRLDRLQRLERCGAAHEHVK